MSESKGPFDAALLILDEAQGELFALGEEEDRAVIIAAYRVLEAAGKVDKVSELATLAVIRTELNLRPYVHCEIDESVRRVRALLEALPDKEEK